MLSFDQIVVFLVIAFILISLYKELIGPAFTFLIGVMILGIFEIVTPKEILAGFANEQLVVVILLLLIGDIIRRTGLLDAYFAKIFDKNSSKKTFLFKMTASVAGFSAFLNNTPLVAIMMPYVNNWSKSNGISPSKMLIPLSYATIIGGTATLIGTSTNLIVNGMVIEQKIIPNMEKIHMFDFAWVGLPMIVIGVLYLVFFSDKLLPNHQSKVDEFNNDAQNYIVEVQIRKNSSLIGKTIEEARLRNLQGLFLVEIIRDDQRYSAISPDTLLLENDYLYFAGKTEMVAELLHFDGLTFPQIGLLKRKTKIEVVEIVITHNSSLISRTVKEANFRGKYDAAILGIQRNGERLSEKIGEIKLKAGDLLLLLAGSDLNKRDDVLDFYFISKVKEINEIPLPKAITLIAGVLLAIVLSATGIMSLFLALIILLVIILSIGIVSPKDVHRSVDYNLILIIGMSLALGTAMVNSGVAQLISHTIIYSLSGFGPFAILAGIYFVTSILAAYVTNKAALAISFPISLTMAVDMGVNPLPFVLAVAFASAANFMTPIGYQTNLMIYGPGGYKFKDFFMIGAPLSFIYMVVALSVLYLMYF
jgi:di/tricarboxylate transporter